MTAPTLRVLATGILLSIALAIAVTAGEDDAKETPDMNAEENDPPKKVTVHEEHGLVGGHDPNSRRTGIGSCARRTRVGVSASHSSRREATGHERLPRKKLPFPGEVFRIEGRTAFLILPEKDEEGPTPWVWYAPTLPGLPGEHEKWMFERFLAEGIAIAGIDVGESYGSPAGRELYTALHEELVRNRGMAARSCLLARSRGGLMLYGWAVEHPENVACIAGIYPVCNIASYPGVGKACGAYGMSRDELEAVLARQNPVDRLAPLAEAHVPIRHIHGDSDRVVPLKENTALLAERYRKLGGSIAIEVVEGGGHDCRPGWFHSRPLVEFVISHAQEPRKTP